MVLKYKKNSHFGNCTQVGFRKLPTDHFFPIPNPPT